MSASPALASAAELVPVGVRRRRSATSRLQRQNPFARRCRICGSPDTVLGCADCRGAGACRSDRTRALPGRAVLVANCETGATAREETCLRPGGVRPGGATCWLQCPGAAARWSGFALDLVLLRIGRRCLRRNRTISSVIRRTRVPPRQGARPRQEEAPRHRRRPSSPRTGSRGVRRSGTVQQIGANSLGRSVERRVPPALSLSARLR
jgi:hypothetical protein